MFTIIMSLDVQFWIHYILVVVGIYIGLWVCDGIDCGRLVIFHAC